MKFTIRLKLVLLSCILIASVGGFVSYYTTREMHKTLFRSFEDEAMAFAKMVARSVTDDLYRMDLRSFRRQLGWVRNESHIRSIYLLDPDGVILSDGTESDPLRGQPATDPFFKDLIHSDGWISRGNEKTLEIGGPILLGDGSRLGFLRVVFSYANVTAAAASATTAGLLITLVAVGIGGGIAVFLEGFLARPLEQMAKAAEGIGRGELDQRVFIERGDEIGQLAEAINRMADTIQARHAEIRTLNQNLEKKVAERTRQLENVNGELAEANRKQADFAAMIAHDFRAPLVNVIGAAGMVEDGLMGPVNDEQKQWLSKIENESRRLVDFLNDFLDLSKLEAGRVDIEKKSVDLNTLIKNSVENAAALARNKNLSIQTRIEGKSNPAMVDPGRMGQVLMNLLSNAIKFTDDGGRIEVGAGTINGSKAPGSMLEIWVIDNGVGIPSDEISDLFQKYRQTGSGKGSKEKGTGLGLVICKMIVEAHGGEIQVESEPGKGSTFTVRIPAV